MQLPLYEPESSFCRVLPFPNDLVLTKAEFDVIITEIFGPGKQADSWIKYAGELKDTMPDK